MIYVLLGKSASGKDTLMNEVLKHNLMTDRLVQLRPLVSTTSRPIRDGEIDGKDYNFVSKDEFETLINNNQMLEYRAYNTLVDNKPDIWYYGTPKFELEENKNYICVLDVDGAKSFKEYFGNENVECVYLELDDKTREERASQRGSFNKTEWDRRCKDDAIKFSEENLKDLNIPIVLDSSWPLLLNKEILATAIILKCKDVLEKKVNALKKENEEKEAFVEVLKKAVDTCEKLKEDDKNNDSRKINSIQNKER